MDKKSDRGVALFISILLHSLLALFPLQEKSRPSAVSSTPISSISLVDISQLPTLPASESQPTPAVPLSPPVAIPVDPPADVTPDAPITETSARPIDEPVPEATPDADVTPDAPITETNDRPIDKPAPTSVTPDADVTPDAPITKTNDRPIDKPAPTSVTPADEVQIAADWKNLVGHLQRQDEGFGFTLLEIFEHFGEPEQVDRFFDENDRPKLNVSSFSHFPEQTPEQVFRDVVMPELNSNTGFDLQPQKNFPTGLAYQLLQGEMLRYLIIVRLNERSGSVLMFSDSLPGLEPQKP